MDASHQNPSSIPTIHDFLENVSARIAEGMGAEREAAVTEKLSFLKDHANTESQGTIDSLFSYIAVAHGLHRASHDAIVAGRSDWDELHSLAQLFLSYAVADIGEYAILDAHGQDEIFH